MLRLFLLVALFCEGRRPRLVSYRELSEITGVNANTLRDLKRRGRLGPHYRIGRAVRFDLSEVLAVLREQD